MSDRVNQPLCVCGKKAVRYAPDPFTAEVWPEEPNPSRWWCDDCYQARKDDV